MTVEAQSPPCDLADDRRVGQAVGRHQRIGLGGVAGGLVGLERADEDLELVERGHALAAHRRMRGAARDREPERDRAGVGDDDVEAGRLGDDRDVAGRRRRGSRRACPGRRPPRTARWRRESRRSSRSSRPASTQRPHGREDRGDAALHVDRAAAVQPSPSTLAGPRVPRPRRGVAHAARRPRGRRARSAARPGRPEPTEDDRQRGRAASPRPASRDRRAPRRGPARCARRRQPTSASSAATRSWTAPSSPVTLGIADEPRQRLGRPVAVDRVGRRAARARRRPPDVPVGVSHAGSAGSCRSGRRSR